MVGSAWLPFEPVFATIGSAVPIELFTSLVTATEPVAMQLSIGPVLRLFTGLVS